MKFKKEIGSFQQTGGYRHPPLHSGAMRAETLHTARKNCPIEYRIFMQVLVPERERLKTAHTGFVLC